ncbi:DUF5723 family protein [Mucilaginibacter ginkgonis]|uniref:DUF5723 domain-containing protein n=1 Tax=Mucilaginibacter ginkgonis TaxID=2682091 RepID=A0A6I4I485_9SPHI|nr:DUF5723 family protein [Mucilaginibacter ginkgonis]QQL50617.1 hypothetical protein GO620_003940 [Mucilaginibacter ginkgonis]
MIKKFTLFLLLVLPISAFAQRFSQYFSSTMVESFENPAQGIFKPDTTKMMAFNFFVPNLSASAYTTGNATTTLKQYLFLHNSTFPNIYVGRNNFNTLSTNNNIYVGMFKMFADLAGKQEIGFSWQIRAEGTAHFTDETVQLFDGGTNFNNLQPYTNLFNDRYYAQGYHQFSFTYRETLSPKFSVGYKISALSGIAYDNTTINQSDIIFNKNQSDGTSALYLNLIGQHRTSYTPGSFAANNVVPNFKNPGLSVSFGVEQHNEDGVHIQYNIKDLGFIHWGSDPHIYNFNHTDTIGLSSGNAGQNVYNGASFITQQGGENKSFTTVTNGLAEISATKYFWLDGEKQFKYNPILVASKQLFYNGIAGAFINNVQYGKVTVGVMGTYDDLKQFNLGGKIMFKSANAEVFLGTEQLLTSYDMFRAHRGNLNYINSNANFTGAGIFFGFALKFGADVESPANASSIPMGEDEGFLKRTFKNIFGKKPKDYINSPGATSP